MDARRRPAYRLGMVNASDRPTAGTPSATRRGGVALAVLVAAAALTACGSTSGGPATTTTTGGSTGTGQAGSTTPPSPTGGSGGNATSTAKPCTAGQLRAVGTLQGAAGSRVGELTVSDFSDTACTLTGRPAITLLDPHLKPIHGVHFGDAPAAWQADAQPPPPGWPTVTITPKSAAIVRIRWVNWCPQGRAAPLWTLALASGPPIDVQGGMEEPGAPPCNGPGMPALVEVGPFEPAADEQG